MDQASFYQCLAIHDTLSLAYDLLESFLLQYGRDGWCDGVNVPPRIFDVTDYIHKGGRENTVEYWGFFNGTDPNPQYPPGYIMMQSSLVFVSSQRTAFT